MATQCLACEHEVDDNARYCPFCGASMDVAIIIDPAADSVGTDEVMTSKRSRLSAVLVPLVVVGLLVGGLAALVASGDDTPEGGDEEAQEIDDADAPVPTAPVVDDDPPQAGPPAGPPAGTDTDADALAGPVTVVGNDDPWQSLPTSATHLVVAWSRAVGFLDLTTGAWVVHDVADGVWVDGPTMSSFSGATIGRYGSDAVIVSGGGQTGAAVVGLDGEIDIEPIISDGQFVGAADGVAYFMTGDFGRQFVSEVSPDGVTTWPNPLPQRAFPVAVNSSGDLITFGGGGIFALTADDGRLITRSFPVRWPVNGRLVVESCNDSFDCFLSVLDIDTSGIIPTDLSNVEANLRRDGSLIVSASEVGDPAVARVGARGRYEIEPAGDLSLDPVEVSTADGFTAMITSDTIRLVDAQGRDRAVLDLADERCCPDPSLAMFATLGG